MHDSEATVICIDGPSGAGKGTVASLLAERLGYPLLDSGALYRVTAVAALDAGVDLASEDEVAAIAKQMNISFKAASANEPVSVLLNGQDITARVRLEDTGAQASIVAKHPAVRSALLEVQRSFAVTPGLVADGRDMGTVVFPEAKFKVFLTASSEERAKRRVNQLKNQGVNVSLAAVLRDIEARDERDTNRAVSPLKPADDALLLDSTDLSIEEVLNRIISYCGFSKH